MKPSNVAHSEVLRIGRPSLGTILMIRMIASPSLRMVDHLLVKILGNLTGKVDGVINNFPCTQRLEIGFRTGIISQQ